MCYDILIIAEKELLEIKGSIKKLFLVLIMFFPIVMFIKTEGSESLLPLDVAVIYIPIFVAMMIAIQIVFNTFISEKREKTLEILLSSGISNVAIVIGKSIAACFISYLFALTAMGLVKVGFLISGSTYLVNMHWYSFVIPIFASYVAACLTMSISIIVNDEKVVPLFATIVSMGVGVAISYLIVVFKLGFRGWELIANICICAFVCIMATIVTAIIIKKSAIITKI